MNKQFFKNSPMRQTSKTQYNALKFDRLGNWWFLEHFLGFFKGKSSWNYKCRQGIVSDKAIVNDLLVNNCEMFFWIVWFEAVWDQLCNPKHCDYLYHMTCIKKIITITYLYTINKTIRPAKAQINNWYCIIVQINSNDKLITIVIISHHM